VKVALGPKWTALASAAATTATSGAAADNEDAGAHRVPP
jgi:hypothetical protein